MSHIGLYYKREQESTAFKAAPRLPINRRGFREGISGEAAADLRAIIDEAKGKTR